MRENGQKILTDGGGSSFCTILSNIDESLLNDGADVKVFVSGDSAEIGILGCESFPHAQLENDKEKFFYFFTFFYDII